MTASANTPARSLLVVDDEAPVRDVLRCMLEDMGFTVLTAADGGEARAACRRHGAALAGVLLDLTVPGLAPDAMVEDLRALAPGAPVILASAWPEREARARYAGLEYAAYLRKPFGPQSLLAALEAALPDEAR